MPQQAEAAPSGTWRRLDGVDLIRGVAIFFVLMNHINMRLFFAHVPYLQHLPKQLAFSLVWNGQYGVQMFFAVSGFLITATSLRRWGAIEKVRPFEFYLLRFARIAPLFLLLLAVLSALHLARVYNFVIHPEVGGLSAALTAALTFRVNLLEATRGYLPGNWDILWSLSVEEMFYLFFPLACILLRRRIHFALLLVVFVILGPFGRTVLTHGNEVWHEYSYLGSMDAIAMGCLTALIVTATQPRRRWLWATGLVGAVCVGFILMFSRTAHAWKIDKAGLDMSILAAGACMLIAVAAVTQWKSPAWMAPLRWIGELSYEIYLSHMFLVFLFFGIFLGWGKPMSLVPVLFAATIAVAGVLGEMLYRFYTEPFNRWLRRRFLMSSSIARSMVDDGR